MIARRLILVLIVCWSLSTNAVAVDFHLPSPDLETLPNGLQIAWFLSDKLPLINLSLIVQSGFRDDLLGKSGTAELVAETLDRGAAGMSANEIARAIERLGGTRESSAGEDTFGVGVHGLSLDAPVLLDLLGKIATHPDFPAAEVVREHSRILDRWEHIADSGEALASMVTGRILTSGTSYGRGSFVSAKEFKTVTREDVLAFYRTHFTPKNAMLMVIGRVVRSEFRGLIEKTFGQWKGEAPVHAYRNFSDSRLPKLPASGGREIIVVDRPELTQAQVRMGLRAPSIHSPEHYPLTVANAMLGEYFYSRLNSILRDKLGLTYGIHSGFSYSKDFSSFEISSATRNETVGPMVKKAVQILEDFKKTPPAPDSEFKDEVRLAKEYLVGGFPIGASTLGAVAARWLTGLQFGMGADFLNEYVPKVNAVTAEQVAAAAKKDFDLDQLVIVVAGSRKEIEKSLQAVNYKRLKRVTVQDLM